MKPGGDGRNVEPSDQDDGEAPRSTLTDRRCEVEDHSGCPHVPLLAALQVFRLRREVDDGRLVPVLEFCRCRCHADCWVYADPDGSVWPDDCTCNATLRFRHRAKRRAEQGGSNGPGVIELPEVIKTTVTGTLRQRQARKAATSRGVGLPSEQIGEIVVEEWRRRGLDPPTGFGLQQTVDLIARPVGVTERVRNNARLGSDLLGLPFRLRRVTKGGLSQLLSRVVQDQGRVFEIATGDGALEVTLDPASQAKIERISRQSTFLPSLMCVTKTELRTAEADSIEVWEYPASDPPSESGRPVGIIQGHEVLAFRRLIATAERVEQPCICPAALLRGRKGGWEMMLARPLEP